PKANLRCFHARPFVAVERVKSRLANNGIKPVLTKGTTATVQPNLINIEDVEEVIQTQTNGIGTAINPTGDPRFSTLPGSD
ncbi:hypothetical protein EK534_23135, partial [Shigella sonnei]|nr:hypothetical protein [Shigella sonnei]